MKRATLRLHRRESVRTGTSRIMREVIGDAVQAIGRPSPDRDEDVHQVRLAIKRLRAMLHLVGPVADKSLVGMENTRLRRAAGRLSRSRDCKVIGRTLEATRRSIPGKRKRKAIRQVFSALCRQTTDGRESARQQELALAQVAGVLENTRRALEPLQLSSEGWEAIGPGVEKAWREARISMLVATADNRDRDYHEWRKCVKCLYYQLVLLQAVWPGRLRKTCRKLRELGAQLGDYHDLVVAKSYLLKTAENRGRQPIIRRVTAALDHRKDALRPRIKGAGNDLFRKSHKRFIASLAKRWAKWRGPKYR
jgi:CHAD domain-containing protein